MDPTMYHRGLFALLSLSFILAACAPTQPASVSFEPRPLGADLPNLQAEELPPQFIEPAGDLSLRDALALAMLHHPGLKSVSWEIRVRESMAVQAGMRPNPELVGEMENVAGSGNFSGVQSAESTILLSQLVELGGKRGRRLETAELERDLSAWDFEATRIDVLTETAQAYFGVLAAQDRLGLAREFVRVAEEVEESVLRRVKAGASSSVEAHRASVALQTSQLDEARVVRELAIARTALAAMWGSTRPAFGLAAGSLDSVQQPPSLDSLRARIDQNPTVARWITELAQREAARSLADAGRIPDISVGAGFRYLNQTDDGALVVGLSMPIPLFDRNQGAREAATYRIRQAEEARRFAETSATARLVASYEELAASVYEVNGLRDQVLPEAESTFLSAQEFYQRGRLSLTDVLDSKRTLFELRRRLVEALLRSHVAVADIERLTGESISDLPREQRRP